jgi:hypothetical protein
VEEKEATAKNSIEATLESFLQSRRVACNSGRFVHKTIGICASPEEGTHLIRAFVRIKQPELRAAIIKLVTQIADDGALTMTAQN